MTHWIISFAKKEEKKEKKSLETKGSQNSISQAKSFRQRGAGCWQGQPSGTWFRFLVFLVSERVSKDRVITKMGERVDFTSGDIPPKFRYSMDGKGRSVFCCLVPSRKNFLLFISLKY